jgi:hypothetical protein
MVVYPEEIDGFMDVIKAGMCNMLRPDIEPVGPEISPSCASWESSVTFAMLNYDEASQLDPRLDGWMVLAQNAALSAHTLILGDGPALPKCRAHMWNQALKS